MVVGVGSKNISGSFIEVIEQQGWQGLWAGNGINMLRIIPTQAIELGTFECVKRAMTTAQEKWSQEECPKVQIGPLSLSFSLSWISPVAVAGAAAGVVSTLACHPLEVLKVFACNVILRYEMEAIFSFTFYPKSWISNLLLDILCFSICHLMDFLSDDLPLVSF